MVLIIDRLLLATMTMWNWWKRKYHRVLTSVGEGAATYKVNATAQDVSKVEEQSYTMITNYEGRKGNKVSHGELVWLEESGNHTVSSTIVVSKLLNVI